VLLSLRIWGGIIYINLSVVINWSLKGKRVLIKLKMEDKISWYHNEEIAKKIAEALKEPRDLRYPEFAWESLDSLLNKQNNYTIGISGNIQLAFGELDAHFPYLLLSDRLTSPNVYSGLKKHPDDLSIIGIDENSVFYAGIGEIKSKGVINGESKGGLPIGIHLDYGKNKAFLIEDYSHSLSLMGTISAGFFLNHLDRTICAIDEIENDTYK
jgi:hypothetical protein